jgi:hypothetical protein
MSLRPISTPSRRGGVRRSRWPLAAVASLALGACTPTADAERAAPARGATVDSAAARSAGAAPAGGRAGDSVARRDTSVRDRGLLATDAIVRALYVNRFAAQSPRRIAALVRIADETEVNALVVDMKDEFGLNYESADPAIARNAGTMVKVTALRALLDTLKAHDVLPIARIVVFKDSVAARVNPDDVIRRADGSAWRDRQGLTWVDPYSARIREYNLKVAEELVRLGFGEIQFDYIRFPEPYRSLPAQHFPRSAGVARPDAIAAFLREARTRLNALGVRSTADVFGLVTTVNGPLEIAQHWERLAPVTDVLLPMVYPSHYPRGSLGVARPNASPYDIVHRALVRARERDEALGIGGEHVRPYLQAFTLGAPAYGPAELRAQLRATYDAGYEGWVLWHPGSKYEPFVPAFERTLAKRARRGGAIAATAGTSPSTATAAPGRPAQRTSTVETP